MVELKEIYTEYAEDIKVLHNDSSLIDVLSYTRFCWLLRTAFKHVKIREYRSVRIEMYYFNNIKFCVNIFLYIRIQAPV